MAIVLLSISGWFSCVARAAETESVAPATDVSPKGVPDATAKPASSDAPAGDFPATPDTMPKVLDEAAKLWEIPIPEPVLEKPVPLEVRPTPAVVDVPYRLPVERDPIARTAMTGASTNADSLTDGLGGMPAPLDVAYLPAKGHPPGSGFIFGPGTIYPTLSAGASYQNTRGTQQPFQATAGGAISFSMGEPASGRTVNFDYAALARFPAETSDSRLFDQQLSFRALLGFTKLRLGLGITYSGLSGVSRDVGRAADRDLLTVSGIASYEISPKTSLDLDVGVPIREYSDGVDSGGVTTTGFLNFRYSPKTTIGVGLGGGFLQVQGGGTQTYGQLLTRLSLASSEVMAFFGTFGVELRDAGDTQTTAPVFGLGTAWTPRLGTSFTVSADRRQQNSATTSSQNYVTTSFTLTAAQRLGSRMGLQLSGGYEDAQYYSLSSAVTTNRRDQLFVAGVGLNAQVTKHLTATLQYAYTQNHSSLDSFGNSRAQFQINFNF